MLGTDDFQILVVVSTIDIVGDVAVNVDGVDLLHVLDIDS